VHLVGFIIRIYHDARSSKRQIKHIALILCYPYTNLDVYNWVRPSVYVCLYTGCPRRNVPDFGRVFLMLKYNDITQNTYIQSWTVTEIMAREKLWLLAVPNTATCTADTSRDNANVLESECSVHCACVKLCAVSHVTSPRSFLMYSACNPKDKYDTSASVFVVQFNGFMSLTS